jgi:uncharacterized protein (DUF697 family)
MTRKPLPKAIRRSLDELRVIAAAAVADDEAPTLRSAAPKGAIDSEPALEISTLPVANDTIPAASAEARSLAARRRSLGRKIVERHRTFAAVGGLLPLPVVNIAGVTAIILRMVKQLSELYGVPFERERTRSAIIGLMGGAAPTGLAAATASTLAFVVPGAGLFGLAVSAVTAGVLTRGIGLVFLDYFEGRAMPGDPIEAKPA